jgi:hypothetical protein
MEKLPAFPLSPCRKGNGESRDEIGIEKFLHDKSSLVGAA